MRASKWLIVVKETEAYVVKKIFRDYLSGVPIYMIHKSAKEMGFPRNGNEAIVRILRNNLYAGLVRVNATEQAPQRFVKGVHEAIISEEILARTRNAGRQTCYIELEVKKKQLVSVENKLEGLEDKVLNDIINGDTYKKGYKKFSIEIVRLKSQIADLAIDIVEQAKKQIELIPQLLNLPELFKRATINQQHSILNRVFNRASYLKRVRSEHLL